MERRVHPRVELAGTALYRKDIYPKLTLASILDLSVGGTKIETLFGMRRGDRLEITIGIGQQAIKCRGKVIYVLQPETGKTQAGIQLEELSEHDKHHLRQYLFSIMEEEAMRTNPRK